MLNNFGELKYEFEAHWDSSLNFVSLDTLC
jgi:hypothetical protein